MKPYQSVPIQECGEPLVPIPPQPFYLPTPHPYLRLGAPYGDVSPYRLRQGVLDKLHQAHLVLQQQQPGWQIYVFDAYRPIAVQQFMVEHTFAEVLQREGCQREALTPAQADHLWQQVYQIWAQPSYDLNTPPPHSTGAAVDLTLMDAEGKLVWMGSEIDELSERSHPHYFAKLAQAADLDSQIRLSATQADRHRTLLHQIMSEAGFNRHPGEWWHFSWGDQMWAWLEQSQGRTAIARYGRVI
uniref:D-alanyl-D-alanine dipeptidase n=1 Tax=Cyanothece sp. (strain PCC 7425 / ATCC 29141) TaxID=395961 RepID=B8HK50_CYAP4